MLAPGRLTTGMVPGLVEALTSRELEVLGMLAAGRSNHAVAGELVVTINTVKTCQPYPGQTWCGQPH